MKVLIFGATGMVGKGVVLECLDAPQVDSVIVVGRSSVGIQHEKLKEILHKDFRNFRSLEDAFVNVDACFWCLGVSSTGMDEEKYRLVTQDFTLAAASLLFEKSPQATFCFVSGAGADETGKSKIMWARVKGNTEAALKEVDFKKVFVFRPSVILPMRGVRSRVFLYRFLYVLLSPLTKLFRRLDLASSTVEIGRAMIAASLGYSDQTLLFTKQIKVLSKKAPYSNFRESLGKRILGMVSWGVWLLIFVSLFLLLDAWTAMGRRPDAEMMSRSPQWIGESFGNPEPLYMDYNKMVRTMFDSSEYVSPNTPVKTQRVDPEMYDTKPVTGLRITWLGHSTLIIEIDGKTFLTDPVWGPRSSPYSWLGPSRWYPPLMELEELPELDAILISHDHYDHLDYPTILALLDSSVPFVVPLGVSEHLRYWGVPQDRIIELDWWNETSFQDLKVVCVPSRHMSGRSPLGMKSTLWAGYVAIGPEHRVYFSGDTGMFSNISDIGDRFGPFDVTMIEVGAYNSAWPDVHLGPEQAVRAHQMVQGRVMIPIHWGLFDLALHGWTEPIERTQVAAKKQDVRLLSPKPGQSLEPSLIQDQEKWWPEIPWQTAEEHPVKSTLVK